jgi:hypothetical protein
MQQIFSGEQPLLYGTAAKFRVLPLPPLSGNDGMGGKLTKN